MMNLKIVYPLSVSRVNQDGSPYEFTENRFFDQTKLFVDYQRIDSGYVAKDDDNYYLIPDEAGVEINPEMHKFGNPDINEAYKRTENVSDYTKAYAAFGKDRSLDYSAQIDKDLLDTNTENILGVSLVKVDENYQPSQVMPSVIGPGEQKNPTNNALLKETLDLIRSHIANKSNAHAIESIVGLSSSLNQLVGSISNVNTIANNSLEIAEGAATTAGEAVQSINEHASSTTNPHATNVTQEFADTQITPLAAEATYTPTVWAYLVGIFTSVPKSVKAHLVKMWGNINDMAARVGILEDSISTIEQTADDAQTAVSNHINATTAHSISQVDGLQTALNGKAPSSHGHAISDVSGLQTALNSKAPYGSYLSAVTTDSTLTGDGTASSPLSVNVSSSYNTLIGEATLSLGVFSSPEENIAITTVTSALITNANFKGATLIPMTTSDHEDLDEHSVEGINFMVENIIDNTSFDIRIFAPNGSWGNYKYKYIITY